MDYSASKDDEVNELSETIKKKTGKAVIWSFTTEIIAKLIVPIVNIVLARLLTPNAFGAVATINVVITFAEIFTDAGFQKYIVQHEFESDDQLDKGTNVAFWTNLSLSAILVLLIVLFRHNIASMVGSENLGNAIGIASLVIIMVSFSSIQTARFRRALDFKSLFFIRLGSSAIPLVVTVPLAFILRNFWALVIGTLCVNLFNAVALTIKSKWKPQFYFDFKLFGQMFSFTAWSLLESLLVWLTLNADIFIVGNALDNYYLGLYKTSMTTVNSYMSIISSAVVPVLFSTLSRYQNDEEQFRVTYWKFFKYTAILVIPMSVGAFVFSDFLTSVLLGSQWSEAAGFIGLWGLMSGITIIFSNFASEVYRSKGNPKLSMLVQALHIVFVVPAVLISVNHSFTFLYTVRAFMRIQIVLTNIIIMKLAYKFKIYDMLKNVFPALVSTLIMAVAGFWLSNLMGNLWWQIISIFICILVYFVSLLFLFPKIRRELFSLPFVKKHAMRRKK